MKNKATWLIYLGTFLLTPGVLALEVSLTRIFSVLTYHHLTFVVISLATLGFGIAGSVLSRASHPLLVRGRRPAGPQRPLFRHGHSGRLPVRHGPGL
jgi:hypothetical protein